VTLLIKLAAQILHNIIFFYIQVQKEAKLYWSVERSVSSDLSATYHQGLSHLHPPYMLMPFQFTLNNAIFKDTLDYMREYLCIISLQHFDSQASCCYCSIEQW